MTGLKLYLFGAPRLESDGISLAISRRKGLAILAYLALKGQPQTREALATLFWPDFDQSRALSNLRRELSRLKTGQDVELVAADRRQAALAADSVLWVDVKQFNQLLAQVAAHDNHFPAEACNACLAALTEAVSLYTDRFLAGFNLPDAPNFDDWQFFEAEGLSHALAESLQKLIHWYAGAGAFDEAIRYGRRWLALDPLHEAAHRELMAIYARAGQQAAALRQYDECTRILEEELGIEPEAETTALYEAIRLRKFPAERPAGPLPLLAHRPSPAQPAAPFPSLEGAARYAIEEKVAVGGQGEVFLGRDKASGKEVILKRLRPELVEDAERVARFLREADALRQLQHPNIVRMLDAFERDGQHCIVMEYVVGGTLRQLLEKEAPLPAERVLSLGLELADALGRAHHMGIIHRDLKPGNVLLAANGSPRLTDFGTARLERDDVRLTRTGTLVGSPSYMSPEALRGDSLDPRSDIWSFGVLLYEMLAGQRPFEGQTLTQVLVRIMTEHTPSLADLRPDAPPALVALIEKMLAKEAAARPSSMRQVAAALEAIQAGRWPQGLATPQAGVPVASASPVPARLGPVPVGRSLEQEIRFCRAADGVQIAYATVGEGAPLVKVANLLSHLEYDWQNPIWHHWLAGLARTRRLIRYDGRGTGLSDWDIADLSFEAWVRDLERVVDTVGIERFPLLGIAQGVVVAIAYAARHPERVSHLVLYGGYARGGNRRGYPQEKLDYMNVLSALMRAGWGQEHVALRQFFTSLFVPGGTPEQIHALNQLQRVSVSPEMASQLYEMFGDVDVTGEAARIQAPTLVMHARDDMRLPFTEGRHMASLIPNARFVPLESRNHILVEDEPAWPQFLAALDDFLYTPSAPQAPRYWPGASLHEPAPESSTAGLASAAHAPALSRLEQEIRFCRAPDGVQIAYATVGEGPPLVKAANWLSHLEYDWQSPIWSHWLSGLAKDRQLIRYDERGCGLSDWDVADMSFAAWVRDLETVVDTVGIERFPLLGISQGAAISIAYAARHPQRVSHLILYGGYARGRNNRDYSPEAQEETRVLLDLVRLGWGKEHPAFRQVFTSLFLPGGTAEQVHAFNELQRISSSPENAVRVMQGFSTIDVSELATQLDVPTLVLHARGDLRIPFAEGRLLASLIPGARFVPLESDNHVLLEHEPAWPQFLAAVRSFLDETAKPTPRQAPGVTLQTSAPPTEQPRFVGREAEMAWLEEQLKTALAGRGQVAFVSGEAGQGKTTLVKAFIRRVREEDRQVVALTGNCNAYTGQGDPYLPFREILQILAGDIVTERSGETVAGEQVRQLLPDVVRALTAYGPDLLDIFVQGGPLLERTRQAVGAPAPWLNALEALVEAAPREAVDSQLQQSAIFAQFAAVLEVIAERHPLLLFLDDLQWIDQGSANLLLYLGKRLGKSRILIVGAYRPVEVASQRAGERHPLQQVLYELQREMGDVIRDLGEAEGRAFVDALLDGEPNRLDERFRATLTHQTQGQPLFTVELLQAMKERGDLIQDDAGYWIAQGAVDWERLPARVEGAIGERIARLDAGLQSLLQAASVIGEEFSVELLVQLTGEQPATLSQRLSQQLDRQHRLVQVVGVRREGGLRLSIYRFRHILIQRYLYQGLDEIERAYRHEAAAEALQALYGLETTSMAAAVARHFAAAGMPERAATYWRTAGDQAWRAAAMEEAASHYKAALAAWPVADGAGLALLWQRLGSCQRVAGQLELSTASMTSAFDLYMEIGERGHAGATQRMIGRLYWEQGDRQRALEHYHQARSLLEEGPESVELALTYSAISRMHSAAWEHQDASRWGQQALAMARRLDAPVTLSHVLSDAGFTAIALGDADQGLEMLREARGLAIAQRRPHDICAVHYSLGFALVSLERYQEAWVELDNMLRHARHHHVPMYIGSGLVELASLEWQLGRWRDAFARHTEIADCLETSQSLSVVQILGTLHMATVANELGQFDGALQLLQSVSADVEQIGVSHAAMPYRREMLRVLWALERHDEAGSQMAAMLALIDTGIATHTESLLPLLAGIGWASSQGRWEDAETSLAGIAAIARQTPSQTTAAALAEGRGVIAHYRGLPSQAADRLREAAATWHRLGRPYDHARALAALAHAQIANGQREPAHSTLAGLEALLDQLGAQLDDEALRQSFRQSPLAQSAHGLSQLLERLPAALPAQATPFVGREEEMNELRQLLVAERSRRLLTVVGPGGTGKTRLAIEVAARSATPFRDGLAFVPLASLSAVEQLAPAIGKQLGLEFRQAGNEQEEILRYLEAHELLLVLDNFEHLLDGVTLVDAMLSRAPRLTILATSREPLGLSSETVYRLEGLSYPPSLPAPIEGLDAFSAVTLLRQHITRHQPSFDPGPDELQQMARICHLVQGMPLALVLAANWVELLSLQEIADEIAGNLDLLEGELRDLPARQRSVRAVFHASWEMLDEAARAAAARLSIFRGHFSRQAAEAVAGAPLRTLLALVNKSWLQRGEDGFQMHELVRQYAREQLQKIEGAEVAARDAHAIYYAGFLHEQAGSLHDPRQQQAFQAVEAAFEQASAAWRWLVQRARPVNGAGSGLQLAVEQMLPALYTYCESRLRIAEFFQLIEAALDSPAGKLEIPGRATCLAAKAAFTKLGYPIRFDTMGGVLSFDTERVAEAWRLAAEQHIAPIWQTVLAYGYGRAVAREEGIARLRALIAELRGDGRAWELAYALEHLVMLIQLQLSDDGAADEALACLEEALSIFEKLGDARESGYTLRLLGQLRRLEEQLPAAIDYWQEALARLETIDDWVISTHLHWHIGDAYIQLGNLDAAFQHLGAMGQIALSRGDLALAADVLGKESFEAARYGRLDQATETRQRALQAARTSHDRLLEAWSTWETGEIHRLRGNLEEALTWYERSLPLFDEHEGFAQAFFSRGLADIAAARGDYPAAAGYFEQSLRAAEAYDYGWAEAYARIGLARMEQHIGDACQARQYLAQALDLAQATTDRAITLAALAAATELLASSDDQDLAAEVAAFVAAHPTSWVEVRNRAGQVLAALSPGETDATDLRLGEQVGDVWQMALRVRDALQAPEKVSESTS
jgi:pimeloyl-ACP methyl ester carboxylesterase/predicted ATPase/DNA-binding SARP family transcriptional activator/tRNA A-37 threonylcarbamoyl transferase component Bud32